VVIKDIKGERHKGIIKEGIPAIKYVNFEHSHFPMEINQNGNNEIEEFEKKIMVIEYQ